MRIPTQTWSPSTAASDSKHRNRAHRRTRFAAALMALLFVAPLAVAQDAAEGDPAAATPEPTPVPEAKSLQELLEIVRQGWRDEKKDNQRRETEFKQAKANQQKLLADSKAVLAREEARSEQLELVFTENETTLAETEATLTERLGSLGELFGVVRQVAGDAAGHIESSLVSAEIGGRKEFLAELGKSKALPSIEMLTGLWYELQREMTEQGKIVRFTAPVLSVAGGEEEREVIRAGVFSAIADGEYLLWEPEQQRLRELARQPPSKYVSTVAGFEAAQSGMARLAVDPGRGSLLTVLVDIRSLPERIPEGGYVGYTIIGLGAIAATLAIVRWLMVFVAGRRVVAQQKSDTANAGNPLGRVLGVFEANRDVDTETLELKLDEAVMRESSKLDRFIWLVKVVSVVAPLLGLLGTVTGMIRTFQAITLFGAGDPKMMAGGISEALVTTMLGLVIAIPLVLLHALLASSTKRIIDILDEQSAGLVARQAERSGAGA
jgi:biopolymer transport protein ExbB